MFTDKLSGQLKSWYQPWASAYRQQHKLRQWQQQIDALPLANFNVSYEKVITEVSHITELKLPADVKLLGLERFHDVSCYLINICFEQFAEGYADPLHQKKMVHWLNEAKNLAMVFVEQYLSLLDEAQQLSNEHHRLAVAQAFYFLFLYMLGTLRFYHTPDKAFWQKGHFLYGYALRHHLLTGSDIKRRYKQLLLLAMSNPFQCQQDDILQASAVAWHYAALASIESAGECTLFIWDPQGDAAPFYRQLAQSIDTNFLGLNIQALSSAMNEYLDAHKTERDFIFENCKGEQVIVSRGLLTHLKYSWQVFPLRSTARVPCSDHVKACIGLSATHYHISQSQEAAFEQFNENSMITSAPAHYRVHDWQLVNSSANGYCIGISGAPDESLMVGEIIGLQEQQGDQNWFVGTVRWRRYTEDGQFHLGIQILSPRAIPVRVQTRAQQHKGSNYLRALMLPEHSDQHPVKKLITPSMFYHSAEEATIIGAGIEWQVALTRCVEQGAHYSIFEFEQSDSPPIKDDGLRLED